MKQRRFRLRSAGALILLTFSLAALESLWFSSPETLAAGYPFQPPSLHHPLGTNDLGRDIFFELIAASRISLSVGALAGLLSITCGVFVGVVSGFCRGFAGSFLMGLTDIFLLIPALPLMIAFSAYLSAGFWSTVAIIGMLWWPSTARVINAKTMQVRGVPYIEAVRALGYSNRHLIWHHVLPNIRGVIGARYAMAVAGAMLTEASLSFIGLGDPIHVSWGQMIHFAFERGGFANLMWWWFLPPGFAICFCVLGFALLGMESRKRSGAVVEI